MLVICVLLASMLKALNLLVWNVQTFMSVGCKPKVYASQSLFASFMFCFHLLRGLKADITWATL